MNIKDDLKEDLKNAIAELNESAEKDWRNDRIIELYDISCDDSCVCIYMAIGKFEHTYHRVKCSNEGWSISDESHPDRVLNDIMEYVVMPIVKKYYRHIPTTVKIENMSITTLEELRDYMNACLQCGKYPENVYDIIINNGWKERKCPSHICEDEHGRVLCIENANTKIITPKIISEGYLTQALTNDSDEIFGIIENAYINDWSYQGKHWWMSDIYVYGNTYRIINKGIILNSPTNNELSSYHEQSKVNLHVDESKLKLTLL